MSDNSTEIVTESEEQWILEDLDDLDKAIIRLKVEGLIIKDIAKRTGRHPNTIGLRLKKLKVQQAIEELQKTAFDILIDLQADAARTLGRIMKNGSDDNKIKAAKEILKGVLSENYNLNGNIKFTKDITMLSEEELLKELKEREESEEIETEEQL